MRDLDSRALPGVLVLTTEFENTFERQCESIGFAGAKLLVPHPVQNRTTAELHRIAGDAIDGIIEELIG